MSLSTTFQSKISRTKKRLSDTRGVAAAAVIAFFGLFAVLTFAIRAIALSGVYGVISVEMPVVSAPVDDPSFHQYKEVPRQSLTRFTPALVLTTEAFYFGDLNSFSANLGDVRDKYIIRHIDGEPQLLGLIETMGKWITDRAANENIPMDKMLILIPSGDIPMPIVIQVLAGLRKSPLFEHVILGSGII